MKRIMCLVLAVIATAAFFACGGSTDVYDGGAIVIVAVTTQSGGGFKAEAAVIDEDGEKTELSVSGDFNYLSDILHELKNSKNLKLEFDIYNMVSEVGTVKPTGDEFIAVYLNSEDLAYVNPLWGSVEVDGVIYNATGYGIDEMPVKNGFVFLFRVTVFEF